MRIQHYDLGICEAGEEIEVTLVGGATRIRLMDPENFHHYRWGEFHEYYGGFVDRSPWTIRIPERGHWHLTVDAGEKIASIHSSIRRIPAPNSDDSEPSESPSDGDHRE